MLLFSLTRCSISPESTITSWWHCRSSTPWTDHLESKLVMWCLHSILWKKTGGIYQFEYKMW